MSYRAVLVEGTGVLLPTGEGTVSDGEVIDRFGNPDLMARFAAQYLLTYRATMPNGRFPNTVVEVVPALHMLVTAAELALKADLMRSSIGSRNSHSLAELYEILDPSHRNEVESQFARSAYIKALKSAGVAPPTVQGILSWYGKMYDGTASVYTETRYFAEPTTKIKLHWGDGSSAGPNLGKTMPYPIFMPDVVESLLGTFRCFHGAERLKRLGGDVRPRTRGRDSWRESHGDWGLVPASLGLVVLQIPQSGWHDPSASNRESAGFVRWRQAHRPLHSTSWMYGGKMLLFYRADQNPPSDVDRATIGGFGCAIWRRDRLGLHSRDLYLLADALQGADNTFGTLPTRDATPDG